MDHLEAMLKTRVKTVKQPKRKAQIDSFLGFLYNQLQGIQQMNKQDIEARKLMLLKEKKRAENDSISAMIANKNNLATKYLISRLDWQ